EPLGQLFGMTLNIPPGFDQIFSRNELANVRDFFIAKLIGKKIQDRSSRIRSIAEFIHELTGLHQLGQAVYVNFGAGPMRTENLEPSFFFEQAYYVQGIVFVCELFELVSDSPIGDVFDVVIFFGRVIAGLGSLFHWPVESRRKATCSNQARGVFEEGVIMQDADELGLDVSGAVKRIHQQPARARIQRERHRIHSEITAAQVLDDGGGTNYRRLACLLVLLGSGAADFCANASGKRQIQNLEIFIRAPDHGTRSLKFFLQLYGIALNGEVQIADWESADDVANGTAGEINIHSGIARNILNQSDAFLLIGRQPEFHCVDVISHSR